MTAAKGKRCPRCGQVKPLSGFYRRRGGTRTSPYCQPCTRVASRQAGHRRRQDPAAAALLRAVERYVWVLDLVSRCAQGLDGSDWYYLADKADDLAQRGAQLAEVAGEIAQAVRDGHPGRPRAQVVCAAVAVHGRHYRAGRLLHPEPKGRR